MRRAALLLILLLFGPASLPSPAAAQEAAPDLAQAHVLFLFGEPGAAEGPLGQALSARGFLVVPTPADNGDLALDAVWQQIRALLKAGLAPERLTLLARGQGTLLALDVAGRLALPQTHLVMLGGCPTPDTALGRTFRLVVGRTHNTLRERLLSLYRSGDPQFGSCRDLATAGAFADSREEVLDGAAGDPFAKPSPRWLDAIARWVGLHALA